MFVFRGCSFPSAALVTYFASRPRDDFPIMLSSLLPGSVRSALSLCPAERRRSGKPMPSTPQANLSAELAFRSDAARSCPGGCRIRPVIFSPPPVFDRLKKRGIYWP